MSRFEGAIPYPVWDLDAAAWHTAQKGGAVPKGHIRIRSSDPRISLVFLLGPDPIKLTDGWGGWETIARPRQTAMTQWTGTPPFRLTLSVMLNGWVHNRYRDNRRGDVELKLKQLINVARGDAESPPGICRIDGIPLPVNRWVIESMDMGDPILRVYDGARVRQPVTITFLEYVPPEFVNLRRKALAGPGPKTKVVKCKDHDTAAKVARRVHCDWKDIRRLNPQLVKKANQKLKKGTMLRVPVKEQGRNRQSGRRGGD